MRRKDTFFFLILFLIVLPLSTLYAQESGQIRGVVTDSTTGEVLVGTNVWLEGTSLGASTDLNGDYVIRQVSPGSYKLVVRYIGYRGKEMSVLVGDGASVEINISLLAQALEGEEVIVTAQARGQKAAINQQLASNTISNVVSSEKIRELPDASAATAISRLPGVSLMNGDQVVIRGVQAKLNSVLINGIQLPSTDMTNRSTQLGFISSNMLSGIEVVKTLTPDMDANTIGGVVNLKLREAPSGFHADMFAQGDFNNQDKNYDNYKYWASVSNRFFDDHFGVFLQGNADRSNGGQDRASATYAGVNPTPAEGWKWGQMTNFMFADQANIIRNNGASLILDYTLPNGKIVLQNTYTYKLEDDITLQNSLDFNARDVTYNAFRNKFGKDLMINALQAEYTIGDIKTEFTVSHSFADQYTRIRYGDGGENFQFVNPWYSSFGVQNIDHLTPDDVYNIKIDPTDIDSAYLGGWIMAREEAFSQHLYNTSLDITIPVAFSTDVSSKFKVGGKFYRTVRNNDLNSWFTGSSDPDTYDLVHNFIPGKYLTQVEQNRLMFADVIDRNYENNRGQYYLGGKYSFKYALDRTMYDNFLSLSKPGWLNPVHYARSWQDDFNGAEIFSAGYVMGSFDIGSKLTIIGGARLEHYNMKYKANFDYVTHGVYGDAVLYDTLNTVDRNDDNIFPNVQLRYKFTEWADVRVAYTTGISRPDYRAIVPSTYLEVGVGANAGNTKLKPAIATNYDISFSVYSDKVGLFTISPFYKKIKDIFYSSSIYYKNLSLYDVSFPDSAFFAKKNAPGPNASQKINIYVNNPDPGYVKGFEIDWQTNFWYLPGVLNAMVLNINYTKTWSDMDYHQILNTPISTYDSTRRRFITSYVTTDTVYNARLLFQSNDVVNIALGLDYKGFSGRISFNLQGNIITSVASDAFREGDQYTGNIYRWDFTLQQKLPIDGLSISLSGVNIFHNPIYTYQKFKKVGSTIPTENLQSTAYSPSLFDLSLRYNL